MTDINVMSNAELDAVAHEADNPNGAVLLEQVHEFLGRFIAYPSDHVQDAHALWIAHCHLISAFDTTPRLAFLSAEPRSGKTRALEITELLVERPITAVNISPAALFRVVVREDGLPTILFDEIDTIFGPRAGDHEDIRGLLNAGHRRGAKAIRCVMNGKKVEIEEIEAFCPVALAGLGWLPDTIMSRAITIRMKRRAPNERVLPFRRRDYADEGGRLLRRLHAWAEAVVEDVTDARPSLPAGVEDRDADKWEPLLAVADAAGGGWPDRARAAAIVLVKDTGEDQQSLGIQLLTDLRMIWGDEPVKATDTILTALRGLPESPWPDMKGKPIDARRLGTMLRQYGIKSKTIRTGGATPKGYSRDDLHDAWERNLSPLPEKSATSATSATIVPDQGDRAWRQRDVVADHPPQVAEAKFQKPAWNGHVADVADVAAKAGKADPIAVRQSELLAMNGWPEDDLELPAREVGGELQ